MTFAPKALLAAALAGPFFFGIGEALKAAEVAPIHAMKPLHGITFDVGSKRAISYFLSDNGQCKLVLSLGEEPNWDELPSLTVTRFEAAIPAGRTTRFKSAEGKVLEFACHANGQSMTMKRIEQLAADSRQ